MTTSTNLKLEACLKVMLQRSPLFGHILQQVDRVSSERCPTIGVGFLDSDLRIALQYNPEFIKNISEECLIEIVLPHEVGHLINEHLSRYSKAEMEVFTKSNRKLVNVALDMAINNSNYINQKLLNRIDEELSAHFGYASRTIRAEDFKLADGKTSDFYLLELLKDSRKTPASCRKARGSDEEKPATEENAKEDYQDSAGLDSHIFAESKLNRQTQKSVVQRAISEGYKEWANAGKKQGTCPTETVEKVEQMLFPKIPFTSIFRHAIGSFIGSRSEPCQTKINKRLGSYALPGKRIKPKLELALVIDTSGSMQSKDLATFRGMIKKLQTALDPKMHLLHVDASVQKVETLKGNRIPCNFKGRGGTCFTPAYEELLRRKIKPDAVIFFTDSYGSLDPAPAKKFKTLWVLTPEGKPQEFMNGPRMKIIQMQEHDISKKDAP